MARRKEPIISDQLLDQLLAGADAKTAFEKDGLLDELKKALAERALNAEIDHHLERGTGGPTAATATARRRCYRQDRARSAPGSVVQLRPAADRQVSAALSWF